LLYGLKHDIFWRKFHVLLKRICIVQISEVFFGFLLSPFNLLFSLTLKIFFVQMMFDKSGVLKSPPIFISSVYLCPVVFVLYPHLVHVSLQLLYLLDRLFPLMICSALLYLFGLTLTWSLLCQIISIAPPACFEVWPAWFIFSILLPSVCVYLC
jgi:hypothetical protein